MRFSPSKIPFAQLCTQFYFIACLSLLSPSSIAETDQFLFSIESKSLSTALNDWAKTTNLNYLCAPNILKGKRSAVLNGHKGAMEALKILLSNTKLTFIQSTDGTTFIQDQTSTPEPASSTKTEEVIVRGIRGSLRKALKIKKESTGIVDAISALDINKFPDTNLAEALQRITGVSIDRINNEGNKVTVRGLGPDFNLVTLNGRHMPVTAIPEISSLNSLAPASRSFEFINISADGIGSVEVHKTGQASLMTGGIGATIDIKTQRPLDNLQQTFTFATKAVSDSSSHTLLTPEFSAAINKTFLDDTLGIFISGIFQERHSLIDESIINGWVDETTAFSEWYASNNYRISNLVTENDSVYTDGYNWAPLAQHFSTTSIKRQRKNIHITVQHSAQNNIVSTLDMNFQGVDARPQTEEFGTHYFGLPRDTFFGENITSTLDKNGTTKTLTKEDGVYQYQKYGESFINSTHSTGLNIAYQVSDAINIELDFNIAKAESKRLFDNLQVLELGASRISFNSQYEIPSIQIELTDPFTPKNLTTLTEPQPYTTFQQSMFHDITQLKFQGHWDNLRNGWLEHIEFGLHNVNANNRASVQENVFITHWQPEFDFSPADNNPDDFFTPKKINALLKEFSGGAKHNDFFYTSDFNTEISTTQQLNEGDNFECYCTEPLALHDINETTNSLYIQAQFEGDVFNAPLTMRSGLRYDVTDVSVTSLMSVPKAVEWITPEYTQIRYADERSNEAASGHYGIWLPSLDARLEIQNGLLSRLALSKTISRPDLIQMRNQTNIINSSSSSNAVQRGNPKLEPYTSNNMDLSFEWYYGNESYVAIGYFAKKISNFITTKTAKIPLFDLSNVYLGERAETARLELRAEGLNASDAQVLNRIIQNGGGNPTPDQNGNTIVSNNETDPLIIWNVSQPQNGQRATLTGWELALQHLIGQSGWGSNINYTIMDSNIGYDVRTLGYQFAIPGISDSLNIVGFYEKNRLKLRLAYNWRDQFLSALTTFTGDHPQFTEAYEQWDFSASYEFNNNLTVSLEGINITAQNQRIYSRYKEQLIRASQFGSIYNLGFSYSF